MHKIKMHTHLFYYYASVGNLTNVNSTEMLLSESSVINWAGSTALNVIMTYITLTSVVYCKISQSEMQNYITLQQQDQFNLYY